MCFAPQRRARFRHLNLQKCSEPLVFCTFWLRNVLRATTACTFSTSQLVKVVRTPSALYILTSKCVRATTACTFSTSEPPKVLRGTLTTFTWKTWEPWGNLGNFGNHEGTFTILGTLREPWEPLLGILYLGTFATWDIYLGTLESCLRKPWQWQCNLGNLENLYNATFGTLTTFPWKPWEPWERLLGNFGGNLYNPTLWALREPWEFWGNLGNLGNLWNLGNLQGTLRTLREPWGNLHNATLGTLTTFTWKPWEPWGDLEVTFTMQPWEPWERLLGNFGNHEGTFTILGTLREPWKPWKPAGNLGNLEGTFTMQPWEPWQPLLGNLGNLEATLR